MYFKRFLMIVTIMFSLSNCATIVGGSQYIASVEVDDHPKAKIYYNNHFQGTGVAKFKVKRVEANNFVFEVKQDGCPTQSYSFVSRKFRTGAFVCSLLFWSFSPTGAPFPIPIGGVVDLATGAVWKPDNTEFGVTKLDYKNFKYTVDYTDCSTPVPTKSIELIVDVVYLKNGSRIKGLITEIIPSQHLKIQTSDGSLFVFQMEEVEKVSKETMETVMD